MKRHHETPGLRRAQRLQAQLVLHNTLGRKIKAFVESTNFRKAPVQRRRDSTGLKRWYVPGTEIEGTGVMTRYAVKEKRRRRIASRIAHESRRRNFV